MNAERSTAPDRPHAPAPRRLFIHEPGWRIAQKVGNVREFCYMMAPGQEYYHRLQDGELYLFHGDERLCMACASRRGLISDEPKPLREGPRYVEIDTNMAGDELELVRTDRNYETDDR